MKVEGDMAFNHYFLLPSGLLLIAAVEGNLDKGRLFVPLFRSADLTAFISAFVNSALH